MNSLLHYPVSAEYSPDGWESPGLAFEDYTRCHTEQHLGRQHKWVPEFALNQAQLQRVLMVRAWWYVHGPQPFPRALNWEELNQAATAKAIQGHEIHPSSSAVQFAIKENHIKAVQRAGGYLQLQAAIAFRAWRLNQSSVDVADSLGITSVNVRATLQRLRDTAATLGFPVGERGHGYGTKRPKPSPLQISEPVPNYDSVLAYINNARQAGLYIEDFASYVDFARRLNIQPMTHMQWLMLETQCTPRNLQKHQAAFSPA